MEFISSEEFLRQDKEVQEAFLNWWKPSFGDLYTCDNNGTLKIINEDVESELEENKDFLKNTIHCFNSLTDRIIPLLTEGQLRRFIEDKTNSDFEVNFMESYNTDDYERCISIFDKDSNLCKGTFQDLDTDLLQAYWKVAIEIAEEKL